MRGPLPSLYLAHLLDSWRLRPVSSVPAEGVAGATSRTGASLVRGRSLGIGSVGCTIHQRSAYLARVGFPVQGRSAPRSALYALYNPEGRHTYVGKGVRSAAQAYRTTSGNGRFCTGIHLCSAASPALTSWRRSLLSHARSDVEKAPCTDLLSDLTLHPNSYRTTQVDAYVNHAHQTQAQSVNSHN